MKYYNSPRWSGEILDCSMPMTFDTYSKCSFNCLYCFSFFQKSHSMGGGGTFKKNKNYDYQSQNVSYVNVQKIKNLFNLESKSAAEQQFNSFIKDKIVMQWGGLSDQFDNHEKTNGITLELMQFFKEKNYPLCFSTKAVWQFYDERYRAVFKNQDNWNMKISIINLDENRSRKMEKGVVSPMERLKGGMEYTKLNKGGFTLRLRPFIIGFSDRNNEHLKLIEAAKQHGATAISTEFFCLETRADERLMKRYNEMSNICGFDIYDFYKRNSRGAGYRRLNYNIKKPFINEMKQLADKLNLRFYVSDAHHKEKCHNGSCCGLSEKWNYSKGQFTEALIIAREKGVVHFKDISPYLEYTKLFKWGGASGFNYSTSRMKTKRHKWTMFDYIRNVWNTPNNLRSPYKYFEGVLTPESIDENNDVVYVYNSRKATHNTTV